MRSAAEIRKSMATCPKCQRFASIRKGTGVCVSCSSFDKFIRTGKVGATIRRF